MQQDKFLQMSDAQAIAESADSSVLDLQKPGDSQRPLYWILRVTETFETSTSATLTASLQTAAASSFAEIPGMAVGPVAAAGLTEGTILLRQPIPACDVERYLKTTYTVDTGTTFTAGKIDSYISENAGGVY